jgi:hypothetical protein
MPGDLDAAGWADALAEAQAHLVAARTRLASADDDYTYARNRQKPRGAELQKIVAARDAARTDYARARCLLPALVGQAQRAGVRADVWRDYPASVE